MNYYPHQIQFWDALDSAIENGQLKTIYDIALNELESVPFWRLFRKRRLLLVSQIVRACRLSLEQGKKNIYREAVRPQ